VVVTTLGNSKDYNMFNKTILGELTNLQKVNLPAMSTIAFWSFYVRVD